MGGVGKGEGSTWNGGREATKAAIFIYAIAYMNVKGRYE